MANSPAVLDGFTLKTALAKVLAAEDAWNSRDPQQVSLAYSEDSEWRNRDRFLRGRDQIREFLAVSGRESSTMVYIHPDECDDCEACIPECPVEAIFYEDNVPTPWLHYSELNASDLSPDGRHLI